MNEEEKEALETFKHWIEYEKNNKEKINKADELISMQECILGIIEKQQKEIEELKNDHIDFWINTKEVEDMVRGKFINKDKIKEKIKLLKDIKKANCYKQLTQDYLKGAIEQLEELLGE